MFEQEFVGRALRNKDPEIYQVVTGRTGEARMWFIPTPEMHDLLGGIIARYQEIFEITIYAYVFLSNHFHLLVRAPKSNLHEFCQNVEREISRRVNWKNDRSGALWADRYKAQPVGSDSDLLDAFLYICANPTRHGLVRDSSEWPGLNSYDHVQHERDRIFEFYYYSAKDDEEKIKTHALKISVLPHFASLSRKKRKAEIRRLLHERADRIAEERHKKGEGFLGRKGVLTQTPGAIPQNVSRTPFRGCFTRCNKTLKEFQRTERDRAERYREASIRFRLGDYKATFPLFTFKPPLHLLPRSKPFTPLSPDFLKIAA